MHSERHFAFQMHKIIFFPENLKQILGFTSKFRYGQVTLNTGIFFIWPKPALVSPVYRIKHIQLVNVASVTIWNTKLQLLSF